jgi:hypothetical protein
MPDPGDHTSGGFHLPEPSALPFATSVGIALVFAGLVPDARIWRLALVSLGATIAIIFGAQWVRAAIAEFNDLPE